MKKTLAIVLALIMSVAMIASIAFVVPTSDLASLSLVLSAIKITDSKAITASYAAAETALAYNENQAVYFTVYFAVRGNTDDVTYINNTGFSATTGTSVNVKVESATADLSFADKTSNGFLYSEMAKVIRIAQINAIPATFVTYTNVEQASFNVTDQKAESFKIAVRTFQPRKGIDGDSTIYIGFLGITKAAVGTGTITATQEATFAGNLSAFRTLASGSSALTRWPAGVPAVAANASAAIIYEAGVAKYVVVRGDYAITGFVGNKEGFMVFKPVVNGAGTEITLGDAIIGFFLDNPIATSAKSSGLFGIRNGAYESVIYPPTVNQWVYAPTYGTGSSVVEAIKQADLDAVLNYFGFQIGLAGKLLPKHFTDKSTAPAITKTATYNMVATIITDDDTTPVQTADMSMNLVIVLAGSAILAAAALAFVTSKAR